jgi:hypothetical protein
MSRANRSPSKRRYDYEEGAHEGHIKKISKKLSENSLQEEDNLTGRIKTIDADITETLREAGLGTSKLVIEKTRDENAAAKSPRIETKQEECDHLRKDHPCDQLRTL